MGRTCSTYGGRGDVHTGFWWGNLREGGQLKDPGVDGWIILKWIFDRLEWEGRGMDGMDLAQGRDKWRAVVSEVTNLRVP